MTNDKATDHGFKRGDRVRLKSDAPDSPDMTVRDIVDGLPGVPESRTRVTCDWRVGATPHSETYDPDQLVHSEK